jgi:hypothetical protein
MGVIVVVENVDEDDAILIPPSKFSMVEDCIYQRLILTKNY